VIGTANRNIMTVPWVLNTWSYRWGPSSVFSGRASCSRISIASKPANPKNPKPVTR
jgi:hypothetical protein